jgi:fructose-1,6-bisphosphatase/inositol monophosphatase family enzyme
MPLLPSDVRPFYLFALSLADQARRIVRAGVGRGVRVRRKADHSPVTSIDLRVEHRLRAMIARRYPDHGIIGEEYPPLRPAAPYQWLLDPVDGTLSLTHGLPFYGTIIGLHLRGRPIVGVIDFPALAERYHAARGLGAWHNRRRLRLRDVPRRAIGDEIVSAADRVRFAEFGAAGAFDRLLRTHRHVRGYYDCIAHAWAAEGTIGAVVDFGVGPWDIAATELLVAEAGGRYVVARRRGEGATARLAIIAGKPTVVRWLETIFG